MGDVQATGAIDEDKDSDLVLPNVIRPAAVLRSDLGTSDGITMNVS
jgi:hypothetical protein